jgi:hypothetical protein
MRTWSGQQLLDVWEQGARRHTVDRALLLAATAGGEALETLADLPLAVLRGRLLSIRRANFGRRLTMSAACPACAARLEVSFDVDLLPVGDAPPWIDVEGRRVRPPTSRDLAAALVHADLETAERVLAQRCLDAADEEHLAPEWIAAVDRALADADGGADVSLSLRCDECQHAWSSPFDLAAYLWIEVDLKARALLAEVHELARAYGWSERDILALSDTRRAAYLAMVGA